MNNIVIVNLEEEGSNLLTDTLEEYNIEYLEESAEGLFDKIKTCLVLVLIFAENFIENFLEIFEKIKNNHFVMPILYNIDEEQAKEKYPALTDYNYIVCEDLGDIVPEIKYNFAYIQITETKEKLSLLADNLHELKFPEKNIISMLYDTSLLEDRYLIVAGIKKIFIKVLEDIATRENIYFEDNLLENILKSKILEGHAEQVLILNSKAEDLDLYVKALEDFLLYYNSLYSRATVFKHRKIVGVSQADLTPRDLKEIYNIETLVYPKEVAGKEEATTIIYNQNPYSLAAARDVETGDIIAFICAYPITEKFYNEINSGTFDDTYVTPEDVEKYNRPGDYKLYVSSLCVHPKYNKTTAFRVVYESFLNIFENLAKKGIFISEMLADSATKRGAVLCRGLGMKKHLVTSHNTTLYKMQITGENQKKLFGKHQKLQEIYQNRLKQGN